MRRVYNSNISERANRSLSRREAQVRAQKCFIVLTIIFIIVLGFLFGTSMQVFAGDNGTPTLSKYYKSICIEAGDTLWDIAGEYVKDVDVSRQEYIDEVCELNGICADEIYAGEYIVVVYYGE
ncbi:MAG: LysM peptidoglycan-binding domain-containing protein [Agathobacter sp.]|nr:LysM peptidoglycan-binding domain-containing protein [Agathobacter sp.]